LRRCEQTAKAFVENEPGQEVTDDVRLLVASLVHDAIRTAISCDVSEEGEFLANAIAHDLSATEKAAAPARTGWDGRSILPAKVA
jgi:hypothetical protein